MSLTDVFETRDNLILALLVLVYNGGIGPEWMFDNARSALRSCGNDNFPESVNNLLIRVLKEAIESEEEFDDEPTEKSLEYRRILKELQ